ncbi:MAG TPA: phosphotransferase [Candidatus Binatia bacterium]|nr:phosphotransferase [Candidatus Binatia bacterium]
MASPIPHEALARAVRAAFGAAIAVVATEPLVGDASSRRYVRLRLAGGAAPPTVVAMLLGTDHPPRFSDELGGAAAATELPFVNVARWLAAHDLPVPEIHHDASETDGLLLLEDVGDTTLWDAAVAAPGRVATLFGAAVEMLVALQVAGARDPDPGCQAFQQRFDGRLARAELEHFVEHGIETRRGRPLPAAERTAILEGLEPLAAPFDEASPILAHRDFMAWNIHVQGERLRLLDFQDALLAPDAVDLCALLTDRRTPTVVDARLEAALVDAFGRARAAAGLPVPDGLPARYQRCTLQRALKVIGRFYFLERVKGKRGYLAYLPDVYAVARRTFDLLPALAAVRTRIAAHVPELGAPP